MSQSTGSTPSTTGGEIVRWFDRRGLTLLLSGTMKAGLAKSMTFFLLTVAMLSLEACSAM